MISFDCLILSIPSPPQARIFLVLVELTLKIEILRIDLFFNGLIFHKKNAAFGWNKISQELYTTKVELSLFSWFEITKCQAKIKRFISEYLVHISVATLLERIKIYKNLKPLWVMWIHKHFDILLLSVHGHFHRSKNRRNCFRIS